MQDLCFNFVGARGCVLICWCKIMCSNFVRARFVFNIVSARGCFLILLVQDNVQDNVQEVVW